MNITEQQTEFLGWKVIPARLDASQVAWFLGFEPHEIPVLAGAGLLKPLGNPARNCIKHYATETLQQFRRDEKWLTRASDVIRQHWQAIRVTVWTPCMTPSLLPSPSLLPRRTYESRIVIKSTGIGKISRRHDQGESG